MKNAIPTMLIFSGLGAVTLLAADFWQKKKYTEWDVKEVQKMLSEIVKDQDLSRYIL